MMRLRVAFGCVLKDVRKTDKLPIYLVIVYGV